MTQLVKMQIPPKSETAALIHILDRALHDISIPMDRLERMMALCNEVRGQQAKEQFNAAMAAAQAELSAISTDASNPLTRSKYATYAQLDRAVRPIYSRHNLFLSFNSETPSPDVLRVFCEVGHGPHSQMYSIDMPADGKGAKGGEVMTRTHATGAAVTYGRRYLLHMIFNLAVADDCDGNGAGLLPKKDARDIYSKLQKEISAAQSYETLKEWGEVAKERVAVLPADWQDILRLRFQERLVELRQLGANDLARTESGRDDGSTEEWGDDPQTGEV